MIGLGVFLEILMRRSLCKAGLLLFLLLISSQRLFASKMATPTVSATATLTVGGTEQLSGGLWDSGMITVSFNGFLEMVNYGQYSSTASIASALAAMFSRDYIAYGLYAKAGANGNSDPNVITFQLTNGQTFGAISYTLPGTSFSLTPAGFGSNGSVNTDSGTVTLQVNGTTVSSAAYAAGTTPISLAQSLARSANSNLVTVKSVGASVYIVSKQTGSMTNYPYTLTITHDSANFPTAAFHLSPSSGNLAGGGDLNTQDTPVTIYRYDVIDSATGQSGYDVASNVTHLDDWVMGSGWRYQYDNLNRLAASTAGSNGTYAGQSMCWSYDNFGNRTNQATSNQPFINAVGSACQPAGGATYLPKGLTYASSDNHITTTPGLPNGLPGGTGTWPGNGIYDAAGNVIKDGENEYLYDAESRICAVHGPDGITGYLYNADGLRVGKGSLSSMNCDVNTNGYQATSEYILGLGGEQMTEMSLEGGGREVAEHTNVTANGSLIATYDALGWHLYFNDPLGTRRAQIGYAGALEQYCQSLPYGDALSCTGSISSPTEHHFTGKERDTESGLDYFGARYYASPMGRWMSPDWADKPEAVPYSSLDNPQSLNLYGYVLNNPLSKADADGHWPDWPSVGQFVTGAINAWGSDNLAGVGRVDQTTSAGAAGARFGDAVAAVQGVAETVQGVGAAIAGGAETFVTAPLAGTGLGLVVPGAGAVVAVAGAAEAVHGVATAGTAATALMKSGGSSSSSGKAPIGDDGHPMELHHEGQNPNGPVKEMTRTEHRLGENFKKNHENTGQSQSKINRSEARKFREQYWKDKQNK